MTQANPRRYIRGADPLSRVRTAARMPHDHPGTFDYTAYKELPGWSLRKIKALHKAHMKGQQT